jgi:tetratricopeptide (TPR) repeat protein
MVPNDPTIFFRLGLLRYNNNDYTGAVSAFEKAVFLDNKYLNARFFLGQSYKKVGRKDDALAQFKILNEIDPNNQEVKDAINSINNSVIETTTPETVTKPPLQEKQ